MSKPTITDDDLCRNAKRLRTGVAEIKTFLAVETKNRGFDNLDRPIILFERHWFHRLTRGKFDASHPNISNATSGGYGSSASQYDRFSTAFSLDSEAAMKSASWGLGQVMGFNHHIAGYATVGEFVNAMKESEGKQLDASVEFILHNGLDDELRRHDWRGFARGYNGAGYAKNRYDKKLESSFAQLKKTVNIDCSQILSNVVSNNALPLPNNDPQINSLTSEDAQAVSGGENGSEGQDSPAIESLASQEPAKPEAPVEVPTVVNDPSTTPDGQTAVEKKISGWGARWAAMPAAVGTGAMTVWTWATNSPTQVVITLAIIAGSIIVLYTLTKQITTAIKDHRIDKQAELDKARAHEIQMKLIEAGASKDMNTVILTPPPVIIPTGDSATTT